MKRKLTKLTLRRETLTALSHVTAGAKQNPTENISDCVPTFCLGNRCFPPADSTPNGGCMPSIEVPCGPSEYC